MTPLTKKQIMRLAGDEGEPFRYNFDSMRDEVVEDIPLMETEELQAFIKMLMMLQSEIQFEIGKRTR